MRTIIIFFLLLFTFGVMVNAVSAGGDKVRGDEADGPAYQLGDCPFKG